jgi:DNA-binding IclR family transcriptional regulator
MTYEETAIMNFLRGSPGGLVARREIARKALKRTIFEENPHWADAPLTSLVDQGLVEQDESGHYSLKKPPR